MPVFDTATNPGDKMVSQIRRQGVSGIKLMMATIVGGYGVEEIVAEMKL